MRGLKSLKSPTHTHTPHLFVHTLPALMCVHLALVSMLSLKFSVGKKVHPRALLLIKIVRCKVKDSVYVPSSLQFSRNQSQRLFLNLYAKCNEIPAPSHLYSPSRNSALGKIHRLAMFLMWKEET